jgi:antitoxin component of RelBE/YafQ-DinJ toxin-antitoxin module
MDDKIKKERKTEDINIRIENSVKTSFKQICLNENKTMSEKIIDFILKEIEK